MKSGEAYTYTFFKVLNFVRLDYNTLKNFTIESTRDKLLYLF